MISSYSQVRGLVFTNPLLLLGDYQHYKYKMYADSFLKKDSGIEFEVAYQKNVEPIVPDVVDFDDSPDMSGYPEKRFRISFGIEGLIQLFHVCKFLKKYCVFNPDSCIHVHVACDKYKASTAKGFEIVKRNACHFDKQIVNKNLLKYHYYTKNAWVNYNNVYSTLEFRAVPLHFDYTPLLRYLTLCHNIVFEIENLNRFT